MASRTKVQGSEFGVEGLRARIYGLGFLGIPMFWNEDVGFGVSGLGGPGEFEISSVSSVPGALHVSGVCTSFRLGFRV